MDVYVKKELVAPREAQQLWGGLMIPLSYPQYLCKPVGALATSVSWQECCDPSLHLHYIGGPGGALVIPSPIWKNSVGN